MFREQGGLSECGWMVRDLVGSVCLGAVSGHSLGGYKAVVLKLEHAPAWPGGLVNTLIAGPLPQSF